MNGNGRKGKDSKENYRRVIVVIIITLYKESLGLTERLIAPDFAIFRDDCQKLKCLNSLLSKRKDLSDGESMEREKNLL